MITKKEAKFDIQRCFQNPDNGMYDVTPQIGRQNTDFCK